MKARFMSTRSLLCLLTMGLMAGAAAELAAQQPDDFFQIEVVDEATDRGVPLIELKTVHGISHWTDSAGRIAFREPGLTGHTVFFHVGGHGYEYPADGFGMRGVRLKVEPGGQTIVRVKRKNVAERLYRVTGGGIYRDSVLLGRPTPLEHPVINAQTLGSDSVMSAIFRGRIYWFWGDTHRPQYPLGNFHIPGATTALPTDGGLDPAEGVAPDYFTAADGFAKETCRMPGDGPTWIDGLTVLGEGDEQRMFASYVKIKPPLDAYRRGLVEFNPDRNEFELLENFPLETSLYPMGHPIQHTTDGQAHVYFPKPFPLVRVEATAEAYLDLSRYETYTCFTSDSTVEAPKLDRDDDGKLRWAWRRGGLHLSRELERELIDRGELAEEERVFVLRDHASGKPVKVHTTSIEWNDYRQRWTMIALQEYGDSYLGEIWYAEAERLEGPWSAARKVVSHDKYSFYNPKQHPMFAQQGGRVIYFEGTYTAMFSGNESPTPRYDYNQIMYRLDLDDPRLELKPTR